MLGKARLLVCEDDGEAQKSMARVLRSSFVVEFVNNGDSLMRAVECQRPDAVVLDLGLGKVARAGLEYIPSIRQLYPTTPIVVHSGICEADVIAEAKRRGADTYMVKGRQSAYDLKNELMRLVDRACIGQTEVPELIGKSAAMVETRARIEQFRDFRHSILIVGECGTGKTLAARLLRRHYEIGAEAFIEVDAAGVTANPEKLFGHTDEQRPRDLSMFNRARGGTLCLHEVANLDHAAQTQLLHMMVTSEEDSPRIIADTSVDLELACRTGAFRPELYYRLYVALITLPPLRNRRDDIPDLIEHFCKAPASTVVDDEALDLLCAYSWPGNVRELFNTLVAARQAADGALIAPRHLPRIASMTSTTGHTLADQMTAMEKKLLEDALAQCRGSVAAMGKRLGLKRSHAYDKLHKHDIKYGRQTKADAGSTDCSD